MELRFLERKVLNTEYPEHFVKTVRVLQMLVPENEHVAKYGGGHLVWKDVPLVVEE